MIPEPSRVVATWKMGRKGGFGFTATMQPAIEWSCQPTTIGEIIG
jgi:hypothetical protein